MGMENTPQASGETVQPLAKAKYNRAAIKRHALKVSREARLGKFTRVSEQFIDDVIAEVESEQRRLRDAEVRNSIAQVEPSENENFLTGAGYLTLCGAFNIRIARIIHMEVNKRRTGKTL